ncbi:hypothetical protein MKW94_021773, partial [Papaver nudicaule]|nr:hypothetical protein [Papaver nudicaule]
QEIDRLSNLENQSPNLRKLYEIEKIKSEGFKKDLSEAQDQMKNLQKEIHGLKGQVSSLEKDLQKAKTDFQTSEDLVLQYRELIEKHMGA